MPSRVLVTVIVFEVIVRIGVGGDVSVDGGASVPPRACMAMPSINVDSSVGISDNGTESSLACCTASVAVLLLLAGAC